MKTPIDQENRFKAATNVLIAVLLVAAIPSRCLSQPAKKTTPASLQDKPLDDMYQRQKLERFPDLPYMPEYPGKNIFMSGQVMPRTTHGPSYIVYFSVSDSPTEVLNFYRGALPGNRWKLRKQMAHMIDCSHPDGHSCIVMSQRLPPELDASTGKFKVPRTKVAIYFHASQKF